MPRKKSFAHNNNHFGSSLVVVGTAKCAACFLAGAGCMFLVLSSQYIEYSHHMAAAPPLQINIQRSSSVNLLPNTKTAAASGSTATQQQQETTTRTLQVHNAPVNEPSKGEATEKATTVTAAIPKAPSTSTAAAAAEELHPGFCRTSSTGYEVLLESILGLLFREESLLLKEGSVLDVGAQFGEHACRLARLAPHRNVYAIDPSPSQCQQISTKFAGQLPNLHVKNLGVGGKPGTGRAGKGFTGMELGEEYTIQTIDNLFWDRFEPLAFAHIDVEGRELEVLHGGNKTIQAFKPVFTAELRVHQNPAYSRNLLDYINHIGYDAYVIDEVCGWPHMDYRNLLCFPRSIMDLMEFSDAFNFAIATEAIIAVNSKTIFDVVYPCCALGGKCCPFNSTDDTQCCHEKFMRKWHRRNNIKKQVAMQGFTYSRNHMYGVWGKLRKRNGMTPEQAVA